MRLALAARTLDSVSPLATLKRGYAIVSDDMTGVIMTDASKAKPGSDIRAKLASGTLTATVKESHADEADDP